MKQQWQKIVLKIDALSLRERVIIFAMFAILIVTSVNMLLLNPKFNKQKQLSDQVLQDQTKIDQIQREIRQIITQQEDPDAPNRARLQAVKQQSAQMQASLLDMQKGLVSPDRMTILLEDIMRREGKLQLLSLKTLPVTSLLASSVAASSGAQEKSAAEAASITKNNLNGAGPSGAVFTHGVEIVVQGEYLEMMHYMSKLESMPWQLFWGKAKLQVNEYPISTLTLTLYTLSLDKNWLNL